MPNISYTGQRLPGKIKRTSLDNKTTLFLPQVAHDGNTQLNFTSLVNQLNPIIGTLGTTIDLQTGVIKGTLGENIKKLVNGTLHSLIVGNDVVLRDGTNALTANWDAGAFEIRASNFVADAADSFVLNGFGLVIGHTAQILASNRSEFQVLGTSGADGSIVIARFSIQCVTSEIRLDL